MNTYFKVILEHDVEKAALRFLYACSYVDGDHSATERGKRKDKEKWEPIKAERRDRLLELLKLNYPEFVGRFKNVNYYINKDNVYLSVERATPEEVTQDADPFS